MKWEGMGEGEQSNPPNPALHDKTYGRRPIELRIGSSMVDTPLNDTYEREQLS